MNWLTININPPELDTTIVARSADEFGYGARVEVFNFNPNIFTKDEAVMHLNNRSLIEWLELPK